MLHLVYYTIIMTSQQGDVFLAAMHESIESEEEKLF